MEKLKQILVLLVRAIGFFGFYCSIYQFFFTNNYQVGVLILIISFCLFSNEVELFLHKLISIFQPEKFVEGTYFEAGDIVYPLRDKRYKRIKKDYFRGKPLTIVRTEFNDWEYCGKQIVYVLLDDKEVGLYANALKKVNN